MKRLIFFLSIFSFASFLNPNSSTTLKPALTDAGMQFGFFYSSLAPHGEWIEVESGTRVWRPFHIPHQWRPYLIGRWVWTDEYGWYWMSDESFGWITYHYGRWYYDDYGSGCLMMSGLQHGSSGVMMKTTLAGLRYHPMQHSI